MVKEEGETVTFTCDFVWLLCGFETDGENELGLQMVLSMINWLGTPSEMSPPAWNSFLWKLGKPSCTAKSSANFALSCEEQARRGAVKSSGSDGRRCEGRWGVQLPDKPCRLKSCFRGLQLLEISLVQVLLALLAPSG